MKFLLSGLLFLFFFQVGINDSNAIIEYSEAPQLALGESYNDPNYGISIQRITNTRDSGGFATHIYSQLQAFSADNAYLLLIKNDFYDIYHLEDATWLNIDTSAWNAPRWHRAHAHTILHFDSNEDSRLGLQFTDIDSLSTETVFTFPAPYERIRGNQSFDEVSEDGRWLAGMASTNGSDLMIFALNIADFVLGAQISLNGLYEDACEPDLEWGMVEPDWIGVSPLGNYLLIQWAGDGTERCHGLEAFSIETGEFIGRVYDGHQHGDLGLLPDNTGEFFMTYEIYHPSGTLSVGMRMLPGTETASEPEYLLVMDWHGEHLSCRGEAGTCLLTTGGNPSDGWSAMEGELILLSTDGSIQRLGQHRSTSCGYWVQPRASLSRDGRFVIFASDWGQNHCDESDLGRGDVYLIDLGE